MRKRFLPVLLIISLAGWSVNQAAQEPGKPGKLSAQEIAKLQPGLTLRFFKDASAKDAIDARRVRLAALHVPAGSQPSPWLPAGSFAATFSGYLKVPEKGDYTFRAVVKGRAKLHVNGKETLKADDGTKEAEISLTRGYNRLEIAYASPAQGNASVRLYWAGEGFASEPLPPDMLFSSSDDAGLMKGLELREGRILYATMGCVRCHTLPGNVKRQECVLPELDQRAPSLAGVGDRLEESWMSKWILEPQSLRPEATMPQVLRGADAKKQALDLAAYLATLKTGKKSSMRNSAPEGRKKVAVAGVSVLRNPGACATAPVYAIVQSSAEGCNKDEDVAHDPGFRSTETPATATAHWTPNGEDSKELSGENLFTKIGCVACHHLEDPAKEDAFRRMSLNYVPTKFKPGALVKFLRQPHEYYPWSRMPDFNLADKDAAALAKFLTDRDPRPKLPMEARGDAERGAKLFGEVGCANCHARAADEVPVVGTLKCPGPPDAQACAAKSAKAPTFRLSPIQVKGLRAFLATDGRSLTRETPAEFSLRQFQSLQCASCHRRDGTDSRWQAVLEDEGTPPQHYLPSLTWAGQKLKPEWTVKLLLGKIDHRARPWLQARMPAFPARAELLALGLSHEHGYGVDEDPRPAKDAKLAAIGAKLIQAQGGFNCVNCHAVGKQPAVAPFEAPGINLTDAALRLRYEYYLHWMLNPPRVDNRTRMLKFVEEDGQTTKIREVFDGNARMQFDAIWQYMQTLP